MNEQDRDFVDGIAGELSWGLANITVGDVERLLDIIWELDKEMLYYEVACPSCRGSKVVPRLVGADDVVQEPCPVCGV